MTTDPTRFSAEPPPKKGWFARNWLWIVPLILVGGIGSCGLCCGGFFFGVVGALKSSDAYNFAVQEVRKSPAVVAKIGEPITEPMMVSGNVNINNDVGDADLTFDVTGPKGTATVHTRAARAGGKWTTTVLTAKFPDGSSEDLLQAEKP